MDSLPNSLRVPLEFTEKVEPQVKLLPKKFKVPVATVQVEDVVRFVESLASPDDLLIWNGPPKFAAVAVDVTNCVPVPVSAKVRLESPRVFDEVAEKSP